MTKNPVLKQSRRQRWEAGAPRDAGHRFLAAHGAALKALRPISYRDYVQRGLDLANWDGEDVATFCRLEDRLLVGGEWDVGTSILQPREHDDGDRYSGQFYRDILVRELSPILKCPPRLRPCDAEPAVITPRDVQPSFSREQFLEVAGRRAINRRYARSRHRYVAAILIASEDVDGTHFQPVMRPENLHAAIDAVMWLLTATDQPFSEELRQCEWQGCFNFFLSEKPKAGPRRRYCQSACMEAMHQHKTPERKAAAKAGIPVNEYRSKQTATSRRSRVKR